MIMIRVEIVFDNQIASPDTPEVFVKRKYLTDLALKEMVRFSVKQGEIKKGVPNEFE
jgi:hypothetical protein